MSAIIEAYPTIEDRVKNVGGDLRLVITVDGAKANVSGTDDVSVTAVYAPSGTTLTVSAITNVTTGVYAGYVEGSAIPNEGEITATWNVTNTDGKTHVFTSKVDVVSDVLFPIEQLREFGSAKITSAKFTDERVTRARHLVTEAFEEYANTSFVRRYQEFTLSGDGGVWLDVPANRIASVEKVTIGTSELTAGQIANVTALSHGRLYYSSGWDQGQHNVTVGLVYGHEVVPRDIRNAALRYTQFMLSSGGATDRAIVLTDETGTYRLAVPDMKERPTGIPEVDSALNRHREPVVW